jgi:hypothetical protein
MTEPERSPVDPFQARRSRHLSVAVRTLFPMGKAKWTRWGRGSCEGYGLRIGNTFRGSVSKGADGHWRSSMNAGREQTHSTREEGMKRIEDEIRNETRNILEDWERWNARASAPRGKWR